MNKKGFTLIELLIVVAIIGIMAAIAIPNLLVALQKGKQKATMGDMKSVGTALEVYTTDNSMVPNARSGHCSTRPAYFIPFYIKVLPLQRWLGNCSGIMHLAPSPATSIRSHLGAGTRLLAATAAVMYQVTELSDFNNDITFSNGQFTLGPIVKK